jgi:hypothetical protein
MKIIISILLLIFLSFFGFKFYLLNEINVVVNKGKEGEFSSSAHLTLNPVADIGTHEIATNLFSANTYYNFSLDTDDKPESMNHFSSFYWENGDDYKSILIMDMSNQPGIVDSFRDSDSINNINELLGKNIDSDFELLSYCYSLNYQDLNLLSSFNDLKVYPFCAIVRSIYFFRAGTISTINLNKDINVIQFNDPEREDVNLYFHKGNKAIFSASFSYSEKREIDLFLNTIKVHD